MSRRRNFLLSLCGLMLLSGCGTYTRRGMEPAQARQVEADLGRRTAGLTPEDEDRILALNPLQLTAADVRGPLARAPAPRVICIHGGYAAVMPRMVSFTEFLVGMGYPAASVTNAADGTHTFSCYEDSEVIAGLIAWYYEKEGLRPMIVGHSQGGMQAVKVLQRLARDPAKPVAVWNPLIWQREPRDHIIDPLTLQPRPVVGLKLAYATALCAGGTGRIPPNQWDMAGSLRTVPESVEEFTGFYKNFDLLGGDLFGYGSSNHFKGGGSTVVRNLRLPAKYDHNHIPDTKHLLASPALVDWINAYQPADTAPPEPAFDADSRHILWAADVWHSIRKNWVIELQRLIRAERARRTPAGAP
jgi:hypothetical protein